MPNTPVLWDTVDIDTGNSTEGRLLALNNGTYLYFYRVEVDPSGGFNYDTYGYIVDEHGNVLTTEFFIADKFDGESISSFFGSTDRFAALPNNGFAYARFDQTTDEIFVDVFGPAGTLITTHTIQAPDDISSSLVLSVNSAGDLMVATNIFSGSFNDSSVNAWAISAAGTITGPFVIQEDGSTGITPNSENPVARDSVAISGSQFAVLTNELDVFGLTVRNSLNISIVNDDGSLDHNFDLTAPGDGEIRSTNSAMAYLGNDTLVVGYFENSNQGGDSRYHLALTDIDGTIGPSITLSNVVLFDFESIQLVPLLDTFNDLSGEFLFSAYDVVNGQIIIERYDSAGTVIGSRITVDVDSSAFTISAMTAGRFLLSYDPVGAEAQVLDIYTTLDNASTDQDGDYIGTALADNLNNTSQGLTGDFYLGAGDDTIVQNTVIGIIDMGLGDDTVTFNGTLNELSGTIDGGQGSDTFIINFPAPNISIAIDMNVSGVLTLSDLGAPSGDTTTLEGIENITAGDGDDDLRGDGEANTFIGNGGADTLVGRSGDDILDGGAGDDILIGGNDADLILGGVNDDIIVGGRDNDNLQGGDGNDTFYQWNHNGANAGFNDVINGGDGIDTLRMQVYDADTGPAGGPSSGNYTFNLASGFFSGEGEFASLISIEVIYAGNGVNTFIGGSAGETFYGQGGEDVISGFGGDDYLDGGSGNDTISGGTGADTIIGGTGIDTADYTYTNGDVTVNLDTGQAYGTSAGFGGETITEVENLIMGGGNDTITGDDEDNVIDGGAGDDDIFGGDGNDRLIGQAGDDTLNGGQGTDTADYSYTSAALTIDLVAGEAYPTSIGNSVGDTLISIENIIGGGGNDIITGSNANNDIAGAGGDDTFIWTGGNDTFDGGDGLDTVDVSAYSDGSFGASFFLFTSSYGVTANGGGSPFVSGSNVEFFIGSMTGQNVFLNIDGGAFALVGGNNNDFFDMGVSGSSATGGLGADVLSYQNVIDTGGVTIDAIAGTTTLNAPGGTGIQDTFSGMEVLRGSDFDDTIIFDDSIINVDGRSGDNTFIYRGDSNFFTSFVLIGSFGTDRLVLDVADGAEIDLTDVTVSNIDEIEFSSSVQGGETGVIISANQIANTGFASDLHIIGTTLQNPSAGDLLTVEVGSQVTLNLSDFTFENWGDNDEVNIIGSQNQDIITGSSQDDNISGLGGDDLLFNSAGDDVYNGGAGVDTLTDQNTAGDRFANLATGVLNNLTTGEMNTLSSIENITLGAGDDVIIGSDADNVIFAGFGNNDMTGGLGSDIMVGENDNDIFRYYSSAEVGSSEIIDGLGGTNTLYVALSDGNEIDFRAVNISNINRIVFDGQSQNSSVENGMVFGAEQFGQGDISVVSEIVGTDNGGTPTDLLNIVMGTDTLLNLSGLTFENWGGVNQGINIQGDNDAETITGTSQDDFINGMGGADTLTAGAGDDLIWGGAGDDTLDGQDGDDTFVYVNGGGNDIMFGGDGSDTVDYAGFGAAIFVDLDTTIEVYTRDGVNVTSGVWREIGNTVSVENIVTTAFQDVVFGSAADNTFGFIGVQGNDFDRFDGRDGTDTVDFSAYGQAIWVDMAFNGIEAWTRGGTSVLSGVWETIANFVSIEDVTTTGFQDQIFGDAGDNTFYYVDNAGVFGAFDRFIGRDGNDTADFSQSSQAVWVDMGIGSGIEAWTRGGDNVTSGVWETIANLEAMENITGSDFHDELYGNGGDNIITGGAGDDLLEGGAGADTFVFDAAWGSDTLIDFADGEDMFDMSGLGITFGDLSVTANGAGDAVIEYDGNSITLTGVDVGLIDAADFVF